MKKICVFTGTRADFGLLRNLMTLIRDCPQTELQVVASNMHLDERYGMTINEITAAGFNVDECVAMKTPDDSPNSTLDAMAIGLREFGEALRRLQPDIAVILGDRYEALSAAIACAVCRVPIAHIHGGELSEGALDDAFRHSITKLSTLHFASTEIYRQRVIQLGEEPDRVFCVGAPGVENLNSIASVSDVDLHELIGFNPDEPFILVTYHPATLSGNSSEADINAFLRALDAIPSIKIIFTLPNSDPGNEAIRQAITTYVKTNPERCRAFASLGIRRYLSLMRKAAAVVGNSSSGIIEAPSAHVATLNIGPRQKGRVRAASVIDCEPDTESIICGLNQVLSDEMRKLATNVVNPYYQPESSQTIFNTLLSTNPKLLEPKHFHDL